MISLRMLRLDLDFGEAAVVGELGGAHGSRGIGRGVAFA